MLDFSIVPTSWPIYTPGFERGIWVSNEFFEYGTQVVGSRDWPGTRSGDGGDPSSP